jgi:beta-glucanase (GH16 family)
MWEGRDPGRFDKNNVSIQGGNLVLSITYESIGFRSGSVVSRNTFLYGYFETRAKTAASNVTSSFWFYKEEPNIWTEIDIFENTGHPRYSHESRSNIHAFRLPHVGATAIESQTTTKLKFDTSKKWATYGVEWSPDTLNFYIIGCRTARHLNKYWHQSLHAVFDIETMPNWIGLPDIEYLPKNFEVDYFRVWEFQPLPKSRAK